MLVLAQASLLAIVFSVAFIATQIVSSRYSPEFISILTTSPLLRDAFFVVVASISSSIISLVLLPVLSASVARTLYILSIGLGLGVLWGIYTHVTTLINHATPAELLRKYEERLLPHKYQRQAVNAAERDIISEHPLQPAYDLTRSSIERNELAVAMTGENTLYKIASTVVNRQICTDQYTSITVPEGYEGKYTTTDASHKVGVLFEPVLSHYLPRTALKGAESGYTELSTNAIEHMGDLGVKSTDCGDTHLPNLAVFSMYHKVLKGLPDPLPDTTTYQNTIYQGVDSVLDVIEASLANEEFDQFHEQSPMLYEVMRISDGVIPPDQLHDNAVIRNLLEREQEWYEKVIKEDLGGIDGADLTYEDILGKKGSTSPLNNREWDAVQHESPGVSALINIRLHMMATVAQHFKSLRQTDITAYSSLIIFCFSNMIETAADLGPRPSAVLLTQRYIEIAIYLSSNWESVGADQSIELSQLMLDGHEGIICDAFDRVLNNSLSDDIILYRGFRNLPRSLIWTPFKMGEYSDEYLEDVRELQISVKQRYWHHQKKRVIAAYYRHLHGEVVTLAVADGENWLQN